MAIDVSYRDTYTTSAEDLSRTNKNFIVNEGVAFDGMKVTQSDTPGMSVVVAPGTGYFYGAGTNSNVMYEFYSDANETVTIGASGVSARIDIICLKVDSSTGVASIVAIAGTPSGSPAVPATPASHYKLAEVAVGAGVTTITNANITDTRRSVFIMPTGARNQGLINGYIRPTVTSNNLTLAISTSPTSLVNPTTSSPVGVWMNGTLRWITSALSVTANAGTNWFNSGASETATQQIDYFAYCGYNATDGVTLGFARIPSARLYSDFNATNTNERFCRISTITNAVAEDSYVNVGRFAATLGATASFNWSVPTYTNLNLVQLPIFETRKLTWLPSFSASGSMTISTATVTTAQYQIMGERMFIVLDAGSTTGGTANISVIITLPFTPSPANEQVLPANIRDATSGNPIVGGGTLVGNTVFIRKIDSTNWGLGTGRIYRTSGTINI
jgi:hypothetical protein